MIDSIEGQLLRCGLDWVSLGISGVGVRVEVTPSAAQDLRTQIGQSISMATELIVREDSLTLFGFEDEADRQAFRSLIGVSGIGPRTALAALSVLSAAELADAVEASDLQSLQKIPGVGKKSAQRLVLELAGKLAAETTEKISAPDTQAPVLEALTQLGWTSAQAEAALSHIDTSTGDTGALLRLALQWLGAQHGR